MKKIFTLIALLLTATIFSACGNDKPAQVGKVKVVATIFPVYDWTREIVGTDKNFDLTLLTDKGVDLHSFQPSVEDIRKISECDVFIYVGGESDEWVDDALKNAANKNMVVVNLIDVLGDNVKHEEHIEGMEVEHAHKHDEHDHDHDGELEDDEHIWLSLKNAQILCDAITDALAKAAPAQTDTLKKNSAAYKDKLAALEKNYRDALNAAQGKTLLFGDRFPFRYLVDDYGLKYFAAFSGCSAESEASFQTITFLAGKVDELKLPCVMTIEGTNHKIAETIIANTAAKNQKILVLNSIQGKVDGETYLSIMAKNLDVLREALK